MAARLMAALTPIPAPKTMTVNVTAVNDAPTGTSNTVTTLEDTAYTFGVADFGFSDPNDNPPNSLLAVKITTLPTAGTFTDNGLGGHGRPVHCRGRHHGRQAEVHARRECQRRVVRQLHVPGEDDGGTANGGVDTDPAPKTMTVNVTAVGSFSLWNSSVTPTVADSGEGTAIEVGVKFTANTSGYITGVEFYKATTNTGMHTGSLWSSSGQLLATGTFTNETSSGWQTLVFNTPVAITAGTTYVASYHTTVGHYAYTRSYFTAVVLERVARACR